MGLFPNEHETIRGAAESLRQGEQSCVNVLERCLDRIEEWEPRLKAWVIVDREGALAQARTLDEELAAGKARSPLHGIPFGIKDIIDVAGMPTAAGFRPWSAKTAERDAPLVAALRAAGAVILGKTATTQFAWIDPPVTRNPWNLERTPGGSSSGSAAAVACGMCLGAIGTQTGGSIIRPASFCGVAGFKPSYHEQFEGILPFAHHLDHPGPLARSALDLAMIFSRLVNLANEPPPDEAWRNALRSRPRLGRIRGMFERLAELEMRRAFEEAICEFVRYGVEVIDVPDPFDFDLVLRNHRVIMASEAAAGHRRRLGDHAADYQPRIRELIEEGLAIPASEYVVAREHQEAVRRGGAREPAFVDCVETAGPFDALVMPATIGPAADPSTTGNPVFNSPWSYTGWPAVSFPIALSSDGMPLALQLVRCGLGDDLELLTTALQCEGIVQSASRDREMTHDD